MFSARMAAFLKRNTWVLNLVFMTCGLFFIASAINAVFAWAITRVPSVDDVHFIEYAAPPVAKHPGFTSIAERNLLVLKRENYSVSAEAATVTEVSGRDFNESELQPCTMQATLRATLVSDEAEWSTAVVINNNTHDTGIYTINDGENQILDDAVLVAIRSREIVVRRRDHFERCLGEGESPNSAGPTPVPTVAVNNVSSSNNNDESPPPPIPGDMTGVTKLSETEYRVEKSEIDKALANLNEVATQARIVPSFKNGKANGFKLFSIRSGSIYSKIGLQNGDVIQKINGNDMNSPDRALEIYTKLRDTTSLNIELQRRSQTITLNYTIH